MDIWKIIKLVILVGVIGGLIVMAYKRRDRLGIFSELFRFMSVRKKWWLAPILILLVLMSLLIVLTQGTALAPFIYTLF